MLRSGLFIIIIFLLHTLPTQAQVAVNLHGDQPDGSAMMDIQSTDKGLLVPRMVITDVDSDQTPVENPAEGLMIFNTGSTDEIPTGFYYWAGGKWNGVTTGESIFTTNQQMQMFEAAELYEDNPISSPSTINLNSSNTYYGWVEAMEGETFGTTTTDLENLVADKIIVGQDGLYKIELCASFSGSNNAQIETVVFHTPVSTGVASKTRVRFLRKLASAGDIGTGSANGLIRLYEGDALDVRFSPTSWGEDLEIYNLNFIVNKVGE